MDRATILPPAHGAFDMAVIADGEPCDCLAFDVSTCDCATIPAPPPVHIESSLPPPGAAWSHRLEEAA